MNCTSCGAKLPPGVASCPVCGTPTPYNVTGPRNSPSQYDPTIASYPGSYGGNPPTPSYPYNSGNPPTPPTPYNAPPPPTGYGAPPYGAPGIPPADPYSSSVPDPYSQPENNYAQQQQSAFSPPPVIPTPPSKKSGRGRIFALAIIAVVVVLVAAGIIGAVAVNNTNTQHANATATAQAQASHLTATSVVNANQTATAVAITTTYPFSNNLVLNDPLSNNSKGFKWDETAPGSTQGGCAFQGQSYHVSEPQSGFFNYCVANSTNFANFTYEVEMMIAQGDAGGLIFRANTSGQNPSFYYFRLNQDGTYSFFLYVDSSGTNARTLAHGNATGFNTGLNQTNLISVVAKGSTLSLYINKQLLNTITDSTFTSGQIGLAAEYINSSTEVVYTNAKVWQLP